MDTDAPDTVLEAVRLLERDGYGDDLRVDADGVHCNACSRVLGAQQALVERVYRFEGESNPDDEAIVLGLHCPACGARGMVVSAFGPGAEPEVLDQLVMLTARFRS